jgi:Protein of unknown function (DUF4232)
VCRDNFDQEGIMRMMWKRAMGLAVVTAAIGAAGAAEAQASGGAAASVPRCRLSQLALAQPKSTGAAGSVRMRFVFTNVSATTCKLFGYAGMQLLNARGAALPTYVVRGTSNVVPPEPETDVVMTHSQHASFYAGYSNVPTGGQPCKVSASVEVTPPNDTKHFTLKLAIAPCGGILTLSPVVHGRLPL